MSFTKVMLQELSNHQTRAGSRYLIGLFSLGLFSLVTTSHALAPSKDTTSTIDTHHMRALDDGGYRITGNDPYLVMPLSIADEPVRDNLQDKDGKPESQLNLNFKLHRPGGLPETLTGELFFKTNTDGRFDPLYRLKFNLKGPYTEINLPIPNTITLHDKQALRLDIDHCKSCEITLTSGFELQSYDDSLANNNKLDVLSITNGADKLPNKGVELKKWNLHDLEQDPTSNITKMRVNGGDPYIVSKLLNIATEDLAGLLLEIEPPKPAASIYDFQLFYATEQHGFIESASSIIRLSKQATPSDGSLDDLRFFIPLSFLGQSGSSERILKRLRLDFARHSVIETNKTAQTVQPAWTLKQAQLIGKEQLKSLDQSDLTPIQTVHTKLHRPSWPRVILNSVKKVTNDLGFTVSFLLILILTIGLGITKYRRAAKP